MTTTQEAVRNCSGYRVSGPDGAIGWVEEIWLGEAGEPAGVAVELRDGRRVFLPVDSVQDVSAGDRTVTVRPGARLLQLELPHLVMDGAGGPVSATWRTTGVPIDAGDAAVAEPVAQPEQIARPIWRDVATLYGFLGVLAAVLIAVDFVVAWAVTGDVPL